MSQSLLRHCVTIYDGLNETSRVEEEHGTRIWEGHLTQLFRDKDMSMPRYSQVMSALKAMGCVEQLQRGGGSAPSIWLLQRPPTQELYDAFGSDPEKKRSTERLIADQRHRDILQRVKELEVEVNTLKMRVADLETKGRGQVA